MSREFVTWTWDLTVQANFTAYCNGLHTAILNRGLLQTADTGQIDPATVTVPANNTIAGYTIYKTNDGVGDIFYLKVQWGQNSTWPYIIFNLGTGTDGAGTLTGNLGAQWSFHTGPTAPGAIVKRAIVAGDAGRLTLQMSYDYFGHVYSRQFLTFARTVDSAGAPNARGMEAFGYTANGDGTHQQQFVPGPSYSSVVPQRTNIQAPMPMTNQSDEWNKNGRAFWSHPSTVHDLDSNYPNPNVLIWGSGGGANAFNDASILRLTSYGTEREFYFIGTNAVNGIAGVSIASCVS